MLVKLLIPHAASIALFGAAAAWMARAGTNRTMPDLYLGIGGYVCGFAAMAATIAAVVLVVTGRVERRRWRWLAAHLGLLAVVVLCGFDWLAAHLA